jgi:hypothetical protein
LKISIPLNIHSTNQKTELFKPIIFKIIYKKKKKMGKKKQKIVSITQESNSKKYESLFNNKKYSDIKIKIGEEEIPGHLFILQSSSDYFNDYKENDVIEIKEKKESFKVLLEFFYKGSLEVKDDKVLLDFFVLSKKVIFFLKKV